MVVLPPPLLLRIPLLLPPPLPQTLAEEVGAWWVAWLLWVGTAVAELVTPSLPVVGRLVVCAVAVVGIVVVVVVVVVGIEVSAADTAKDTPAAAAAADKVPGVVAGRHRAAAVVAGSDVGLGCRATTDAVADSLEVVAQ